ncbi:MAG: alpha/beta hydrolase [Caulobacteraceae bacterium]|nr:alpha/beta hydrolase [Caulobacteraceae bacterium]
MARRWRLFALGWALVLAGGLLGHLVQTSGGVSIEDVRYRGASGEALSALLYVPPRATASHPAPAVLVSHGYINTREMQSPFAIELARRGYVVLAIDMAGHGYSGGWLGLDDAGGPDGLRYLQAQPFVDRSRIALEGHSMGGVAVVGAAIAQPDGYRSMVLEGSTTPESGQVGAGDRRFPRNLEVVFGRYDEFAPLMWHEARGADVGSSPKLEAVFGSSDPVRVDRIYGSVAQGDARRLVIPPVTHPWEHFSRAGVAAAVDWIEATNPGAANSLPGSDQIWIWKEVGTLVALAGFVAIVLGACEGLTSTPAFASLSPAGGQARPPVGGARPAPARWWLAFLLAAAIPAVSFYPLMDAGFVFLPSRLFPEWVANQLAVWALGATALSLLAYVLTRRGRARFSDGGIRAAFLAGACVAIGYVALAIVDALFKVDFRFWVVGLKPLDARHAAYAVAYLPIFAVVFILMSRTLLASLITPAQGPAAQYLALVFAPCLGFVVLLVSQYAALRITGRLLSPREALNTIIAIQFVPVLAFVGLVTVFAWRQTGGYLAGGLICALVVTWYVTAGTATHWRPGWTLPQSAGLYPARPAPAAPRNP